MDETPDLVNIIKETIRFEGERSMLLFPISSTAMPFDALVVILGVKGCCWQAVGDGA